jgi:hypothetical protein
MTTTARSDRLLATARDEWPALRWMRVSAAAFTGIIGNDPYGRTVAAVWRPSDGDGRLFSASYAGGVTYIAGWNRTLRAAVRAARYAMEKP